MFFYSDFLLFIDTLKSKLVFLRVCSHQPIICIANTVVLVPNYNDVNNAVAKDIYEKLSVGGQIKYKICQPSYAKLYAEIIDKFGVLCALIIE